VSKTTTPGAGFFRAGSIVMIVTGLVHASGQLAPTPPAAEPAIAAMRAYRVTMLGLIFDLHGAYVALSLSYSWMSILIGAIGLVVVQRLRPDAAGVRALAFLLAAGAAGLVVLPALYGIAPPIHFFSLATALFLASAFRAGATAP
jgi:hypothetical protein